MTLDIKLHVMRRGSKFAEDFRLDVAFIAEPGINILFGPSGSGKSTILQAVAGLYKPTSGHIRFSNTAAKETWFCEQKNTFVQPEKRGVAYLFQSLALFPHMDAIANVCYGMASTFSKPAKRERALNLLQRVGVEHLAKRRPGTFSGGEAQRVALARALATNPRVLLLDEPFSALDRDLRIQLARLVVEIVEELGIPTLQVTHNHGEAAAMGQRILRMRGGSIIDDGTAQEVFGASMGTSRHFERIGQTPLPSLRRSPRTETTE